MARIEAKKALGFYPALPEIVNAVKERLEWPAMANLLEKSESPTHFLDPCCGKGEALGILLEGHGRTKGYAIELDTSRAQAAADRLPHHKVFNFGYEDMILAPALNQDGIGLLWLNPPYEYEIGGGERQEQKFLKDLHVTLVTGGILVFLVPGKVLRNCAPIFRDNFSNVRIYLGDATWKQVIVIAQKGKGDWYTQNAINDVFYSTADHFESNGQKPLPHNVRDIRLPDIQGVCDDCGSLPEFDGERFVCSLCCMAMPQVVKKFQVPETGEPYIKAQKLNPPLLEDAFLASEVFDFLQSGGLVSVPQIQRGLRPPVPLTEGLTALCLQNGMFDGQVFPQGHEWCCVVRGTSRKRKSKKFIKDDRGRDAEVISDVQETLVVLMEMGTGDVYQLGLNKDPEKPLPSENPDEEGDETDDFDEESDEGAEL